MSASSASGPASQGGFLIHMVQGGQTSPGSGRKRDEKAPSVSVPPSRSEASASLTFQGTEQSQRPDLAARWSRKGSPYLGSRGPSCTLITMEKGKWKCEDRLLSPAPQGTAIL